MDTENKKLLDEALKLALNYPESGNLQELSFMNEVELQMMKRLPTP